MQKTKTPLSFETMTVASTTTEEVCTLQQVLTYKS